MQLHTEDQAAKILSVTRAGLRRMRRERRGPRWVKVGRLVRYREEDLERFVDVNTQSVIQEKRRFSAIAY